MLTESKELARVLEESRAVAAESSVPMTSSHVLLCLFIVENQAKRFLQDHGLELEALFAAMGTIPQERPQIWEEIYHRAHDIARVQEEPTVSSLHMLISLCSFVDCSAYELLKAQGLIPSSIRNDLMAQMLSTPQATTRPPAPTPSPLPQFGTSAVRKPRTPVPAPRAVGLTSNTTQTLAERLLAEKDQDKEIQEVVSESRNGRGKSLLPPLSESLSKIPIPSRQTLFRRRSQQQPTVDVHESDEAASVPKARTQTQRKRRPAPVQAFRPEAYRLTPREFPLLSRLGRNLSEEAIEGKLDTVIGRDEIVLRLIDTLNKRRSNNPLLVGEPGVGKTAIVEGFARFLIDQARQGIPTGLEQRIIVSIEASAMIAGTSVRGAFAERMTQLKQEVQRANGRVIIFFDELHHWIGAGGSNDSGSDATGELKSALARGEFPCIGATTWAEYTQYIEPDSAFTRRFETVRVAEPDTTSTLRIVTGMRATYEEHHQIEIPDDVIEYAVKLAHRYVPNRRNPDKSFSVIDSAGALARRAREQVLSKDTVARVVADQAGIDPSRLMMADRAHYAKLDELLAKEIVGQEEAVERAASLLQRNYAGFSSGRPIGSFLFLGPTGVGKTEFARAIARVLFGSDDAMLRIDMSEYMEAHSVARLIGAPPGYVGHDASGLLTEPVRRAPYQLVLLDEIEKAHPDILNLLIQVLDEGRLTDARGNTVDFTSTIVVMTTNLGAKLLTQSAQSRTVGFASQANPTKNEELARREAQKYFRPEIWNRIDEVIVFPALNQDQIGRIARRMLAASSARLESQRGISFECTDAVIELLIQSGGYDAEFGARPMRRTIERIVEQFVAQMILEEHVKPGESLHIDVKDGALVLTPPATLPPSKAPTDDEAEAVEPQSETSEDVSANAPSVSVAEQST